MRNKRNYNNLYESIVFTIPFFLFLAFYLLSLWLGVINFNEYNDPIVLLISSTIILGGFMAMAAFVIIKYCYAYWILLDDSIVYKKLFRKKIQIKLAEINIVEQKTIQSIIDPSFLRDAYIIYSNHIKIDILLQYGKDYSDLNSELAKFIIEQK